MTGTSKRVGLTDVTYEELKLLQKLQFSIDVRPQNENLRRRSAKCNLVQSAIQHTDVKHEHKQKKKTR